MKTSLSKHIIVRFLDGDLSPEEDTELLNRESVISRMKEQWDSPHGDISKFDRKRVFRRIESRIWGVNIAVRRRRIYAWAASVAASVLLLSTIGYYLFFSESTTTSRHREVMMLVFETQNKERLQMTLPDSTKVWLYAGSRIEYPEKFDPKVRQVKLSGEAYFDVTHQEKQLFCVQSNKLLIRVLGTQFTVSDYQNGASAEAVLISGKVNVHVLNDSTKRTFELFPNERLLYNEQQQSTVIQTVDASQWSGWIHGRLHFDNAELGYIINKLGRWYGQKIECSPELAARYRLTFTVRDESLAQVARLIQNIAPVNFQLTGDYYQVVDKKSSK